MVRISLIALFFAATVLGQSAPQAKPEARQEPPPKDLTQRVDGHFSANQIRTLMVIPEETPAKTPPPIPPAASASELTPPARPPSPPAAPIDAAPRPTLLQLSAQRPVPEVKLSDPYCSGFIQISAISQDLKMIAKFRGDGSALATEGDYIYLNQGSNDGIAVGNLYQVIRPTKKIERPNGRTKDERNLGMHYLDIAQINVVLTQPEFSLARVFQNCDAVEIGDIAVPLQIPEPPVVASPRRFSPFMTVTGDVKGAVVTTLSVLFNFGSTFGSSRALPGVRTGNLGSLEKGIAYEGAIVYIDVGQREAVKPGDVFIAYRQLQLRQLPGARTAIGELIVVKVGERASTALVTYADDAISAGDSVERR